MRLKRYLFILFVFMSTVVVATDQTDSIANTATLAKTKDIILKSSVSYLTTIKTTKDSHFEEQYNLFNQTIAGYPLNDEHYEMRLVVAKSLIYLGEFERAEKMVRAMLDKVPLQTKNNVKARCYRRLSQVKAYQGQREPVLELLDSAISFVNNSEVLLKASYIMEKGRVYYDMGKYSEAMKYYVVAKKYMDELDSKGREYCDLMHFMGSVFKRQNNDHKALEYYEKMLSIAKENKIRYHEAEALDLIAGQYSYLGDYEKEEEYITQALNIYIELGDYYGEALTLLNIVHGNIYDKKYTEALLKLKRVEELIDLLNTTDYDVILNRYYGNIYARMGNHGKAMHYFELAIKAAEKREEKRVMNLADIYRNMAYAHYKHGTFKDAYEYLDLYMVYHDSIINKENQNIIHELEQQYENQKKESEIIALNKDKEISDKELSKQNVMINAFIIGLLLTLLLASTIFYSLTQNKKKNKIISSKMLEVEEKNKEIMDSIAYAKRIQNAILPPHKIVKEYLQKSFILYKPKDIVAGDFYWLEHTDDVVLFAAADCTGHGVPGAMVSVICNNGLNRSVREYGLTDPGAILDKTREIVIQEFEKSEEEVKDGMDIALCALKGNQLSYAGAHNPLWIIRKGEILETKANKQPIGKFDNYEPYQTHQIKLEEGDTVYVFSDGYADQFGGEKGKKMKSANFKKLLLSVQDQDMENQRLLIDKAFEDWKGDLEQLDDVCVIGVRV